MKENFYPKLMYRIYCPKLKKFLKPAVIPIDHPVTDTTTIIVHDGPMILSFPMGELMVNQCCGLTDSNKKWIFEGDIISVESHDTLIFHLPVVFVHGCFGALKGREFIPFFEIGNRLKVETLVIIGDVYHNPELLNMRDPFVKEFKPGKPH